ncbi:DinB family protein [Actinoplanes sp. NPDC023936]|uniref:DinB family protein n=1 Tax=Actinoplanes sp. NPDC023936 TaxID=3154910 RepID=UPI0033ED5FEE
MSIAFPEPTAPATDRAEVFVRYLDYYRETLLAKVASLPSAELRTSRLPSGWTPLELVKHLRHVERRWMEWGFQGGAIPDPWADRRDDRWHVDPAESLADLTAQLRAQGEHTATVARGTPLDAVGEPGPRWDGAGPASLERVLFHLLQEYARHTGHIDIVAELAGAPTGK